MANLTYDNSTNGGIGTRLFEGTADDDTLDASGAVANPSPVPGSPQQELQQNGILILGKEGVDTITGSAFDDIINGDAGNDGIDGGAGDDGINGGTGDDTINGEAGNDTIHGNLGTDTLNGGDDNDIIFGGVNNEVLAGAGSSSNTIDGGAGTDRVHYESITANDISSFTESGGTYTITHANGVDTVTNAQFIQFIDGVYNIEHGFDAALNIDDATGNTMTGDGSIQAFIAGDGDDTINAGGGKDFIYDGAGNDTINGEAGDDEMLIGGGNNTVDGGADTDIAKFEFTQAQITSVTVSGNVTTVVGPTGTNTFENVESFQFRNDAGNAIETLTLTQLQALAGSTSPTGGADTLTGTASADNLNALGGDDIINGLAGNDTLTGGAGDDTIDGGDDIDTAVFTDAAAAITSISTSGGTTTVVSSEGTDTLTNVENLQFSDQTIAVADAATVFGTAGNNTKTATFGNDNFIGLAGTDTVDFGSLVVTDATISESNGVVTVVSSAGGTDTLSGIEILKFDGTDYTVANAIAASTVSTSPTAGDDTLTGTAGAESLDGLAGNDTINGLAGDDTLIGGAGDDTIDGGADNDTLIGGAGDDTIDGGADNDTVDYGSISLKDVTSISETGGVVTVVSADGTDTLTNVETLKFNGTDYTVAEATAVGSAPTTQRFISRDENLNETIITADTFSGDVSLGLVYEFGRSTVGNNTTERIVGSSQNDFITLGLGDDAAEGGAGNDVIDGGLGSNFLTGGTGNDVFFVDGRAAHTDVVDTETWSTITDFTAGDSVNIWGYEDGTSVLLNTFASAGASGFEGVTYQYDLDGDGVKDTTITFSDLTSVPDGSALQDTAGENYLLIAL